MDIRLSQQTSQKLVLSPQMRQYLRLLQLQTMELEHAVEAELMENPVLEEKQEEGPLQTAGEAADSANEAPEHHDRDELRFGENFDRIADLPSENHSYELPYRASTDLQKIKDFQDSLITKPQNLSDFIMWQVGFLDFSDPDRAIAEEIVGNLNEEGFLNTAVEDIAKTLQQLEEKVLIVLSKLQGLDPPGICARNLQESLLLQLRRMEPVSQVALQMVEDQFPLLAKRDWNQIAKKLNVPLESVRDAAQLISKLEPRPGRIFYQDENTAVAPDVSVYFDDQDDDSDESQKQTLKIEVHHEHIPELRISPYYRRMLREANTRPEVKNFIREKIQNALNFINAVKLRRSTLHEITEAIIKMQPDFFTHGYSHLRPMRLKDISDILGIHESTVSRALHGKYISTPQGMIPFKSFFSSKLENQQGEDESQKSMMEKIRKIIESEIKTKPLSDQAIADLLKKDGIKIARRTVTKYRELLKIFPTHLRKSHS